MPHRPRWTESESYPPVHFIHCTCGWTRRGLTKQPLEDEFLVHEAEALRLRASLSTTPPSLRSQRDYYRQQEEACEDERQRAQWKQLADEIEHRLNDSADPMEGQEALPF